MPLMKSASDKAFTHNLSTEMDTGKPQKQSLAIAYDMQRRARKKKAMGGYAEGGETGFNKEEMQSGYQRPRAMAEGGMLTKSGYQSPSTSMHQDTPAMFDEQNEYDPTQDPMKKPNGKAMLEDARDLNQHGEEEQGPYGVMMATGGYMPTDDELDMVGRIMKARQCHYSEGGRIANDTPITAGFADNDFDDLALRDDLESTYTGDNSGDYDDDEDQNARNKDVVVRIMRSRAKKDRMDPQMRPGL